MPGIIFISFRYLSEYVFYSKILLLNRACQFLDKLESILGRRPCMRLDDLYCQYRCSKDRKLFETPLNQISELSMRHNKYENMVLNAYGTGGEYDAVSEIGKTLSMCTNWVQDILIAIMSGEDMESMHREKQYEYQMYGWDYTLPSSKSASQNSNTCLCWMSLSCFLVLPIQF